MNPNLSLIVLYASIHLDTLFQKHTLRNGAVLPRLDRLANYQTEEGNDVLFLQIMILEFMKICGANVAICYDIVVHIKNQCFR